jgi:hypothetical protein
VATYYFGETKTGFQLLLRDNSLMDIPHSRSIDSFRVTESIGIPGTDIPKYALKQPFLGKKFITNLSASRIDELTKRIVEQDIIISHQTERINELEHKLDLLMDILEQKNDIWFHRDMLNENCK